MLGSKDKLGSSSDSSVPAEPKNGGPPLWRKILDKLSGIWLIVDGLGTLLMIATALYLAIHLGIWSIGIGVLLFEVCGMLNSFYVGHRQLVRS